MSYPKGLDEIDEYFLIEELYRRAKDRTMGLCDYCGRPPSKSPCKFPERHKKFG